MDDGCQRLLAKIVVTAALRKLADPHALAEERAEACICFLGANGVKALAKCTSSRETSAIITRGFTSPVTSQYAKQTRVGMRDVWRNVVGEVTAQAAEWRASLDDRGHLSGASRRRWGEILTHLLEWVIFSPADYREAR